MNIYELILNHSLLIIPLKMCCIPHSQYKGPIKLVQGVSPGFLGSCYKIWSFPIGFELPYGWVSRILKYSS